MSGAVIDRKAIKFTDEGREDGMSVQQAQAGEQLHTHTRAHTHVRVNNPYSLSLTDTRTYTYTCILAVCLSYNHTDTYVNPSLLSHTLTYARSRAQTHSKAVNITHTTIK